VRGLQTLGRQGALMLHGVGLGLASCARVERRRLDAMARLVNRVEPESWSEHLAFVRGGGYEIGHLAAPPRTADSVSGGVDNIALARRTVGAAPAVENIATLIDPPGSALSEAQWIGGIVNASGAPLLLDLHNVHVNATNFGYDPIAFLDALPLDRVTQVHLAGGRPLPEGRLLDDHKHDVPDPVYDLLLALGTRVRQPLDVILERDGDYPPMTHLLAQLSRARATLAQGRAAGARTA
jgi:uncharacterized protein (UPF0276 family)